MIGLHVKRALAEQRAERLLDFEEFCEAQAARIKTGRKPNKPFHADDTEGTARVMATYDIERRGYTTGGSGSHSHRPPRVGEAGS